MPAFPGGELMKSSAAGHDLDMAISAIAENMPGRPAVDIIAILQRRAAVVAESAVNPEARHRGVGELRAGLGRKCPSGWKDQYRGQHRGRNGEVAKHEALLLIGPLGPIASHHAGILLNEDR